jgi:hypothetical protein
VLAWVSLAASSGRLACRRRLPEREDWRPPRGLRSRGRSVRGVPVFGASAPFSHMRPISLASPPDRHKKEVAETENKAKKKLVSHHNGDFNMTRA